MQKNPVQQQNIPEISQLFDDFAADLNPQPRLSEKAREMLLHGFSEETRRCSENRVAVVPNDARVASQKQKNRRRWSWVTTVAAVFVVILALSAVYPVILSANYGKNGAVTPNDSFIPETNITVYNQKSAVLKKKSASVIDGAECFSSDLGSDFKITYQNYQAYYFTNTDELAYIRGAIGVETDSGIVEINFIAENSAYVETERQKVYQNFIQGSSSPYIDGGFVENGEYVTEGFFAANGYNFYISAQSNALNFSTARQIIAKYFWQR